MPLKFLFNSDFVYSFSRQSDPAYEPHPLLDGLRDCHGPGGASCGIRWRGPIRGSRRSRIDQERRNGGGRSLVVGHLGALCQVAQLCKVIRNS